MGIHQHTAATTVRAIGRNRVEAAAMLHGYLAQSASSRAGTSGMAVVLSRCFTAGLQWQPGSERPELQRQPGGETTALKRSLAGYSANKHPRDTHPVSDFFRNRLTSANATTVLGFFMPTRPNVSHRLGILCG